MDDQGLKNSINQLLEQFGFGITEIPKSDGIQTPDFHATKGGMQFIIELKSREDDEVRLESERQTLAEGNVASRTETTNQDQKGQTRLKTTVRIESIEPTG